jgi:hypothetical protein
LTETSLIISPNLLTTLVDHLYDPPSFSTSMVADQNYWSQNYWSDITGTEQAVNPEQFKRKLGHHVGDEHHARHSPRPAALGYPSTLVVSHRQRSLFDRRIKSLNSAKPA